MSCRRSTEASMLCEVLDRMHQMDTKFEYPATPAQPSPPHRAYDLLSSKARTVETDSVVQVCRLPNASVRSPLPPTFDSTVAFSTRRV